MKRYSQSTQIASFSINHGQNLSAPSGFMQPYKIQIQAEFICQTVRATDADVVRKKHKMGSMIDFTSWISHTQSHHQEFKPPFLGPGEPKTKRPKGVYANLALTPRSLTSNQSNMWWSHKVYPQAYCAHLSTCSFLCQYCSLTGNAMRNYLCSRKQSGSRYAAEPPGDIKASHLPMKMQDH